MERKICEPFIFSSTVESSISAGFISQANKQQKTSDESEHKIHIFHQQLKKFGEKRERDIQRMRNQIIQRKTVKIFITDDGHFRKSLPTKRNIHIALE